MVVVIPLQVARDKPGVGGKQDSPSHPAVCARGLHRAFLNSQVASYLEDSHDGCREGVKVCRRSPVIKVKPEKEIQREERNANLTSRLCPSQDDAIFLTSFPLLHSPLSPTLSPSHVTYKGGISDC